jgi:hypothetical protein
MVNQSESGCCRAGRVGQDERWSPVLQRKATTPAASLFDEIWVPSGRAPNLPNFAYLPPAYLAKVNRPQGFYLKFSIR